MLFISNFEEEKLHGVPILVHARWNLHHLDSFLCSSFSLIPVYNAHALYAAAGGTISINGVCSRKDSVVSCEMQPAA